MRLIKLSTTAVATITAADLKSQTNITHEADDALMSEYVSDGLDQVASDTCRTLTDTVWQLTGACFPAFITLPKPPLFEVVSIIYIDADGAQQTLDTADYQILTSDIGASVKPAPGTCWPATQYGNENSVQITYRAGYVIDNGAGGVTGQLPVWARRAALLWAAHLYEFREAVSTVQTYELPSYQNIVGAHQVDLI